MKKPSPATQESDQRRRFIETARELGCDEDEAAFDEKLKRIVNATPAKKPPPNPGASQRKRRSGT
jgi:hypothetical protein